MKIEALFKGLHQLGAITLKNFIVEDKKAVAVFDIPLSYGFSYKGWDSLVNEFGYFVYDVAIDLASGEVIMEFRKQYELPMMGPPEVE